MGEGFSPFIDRIFVGGPAPLFRAMLLHRDVEIKESLKGIDRFTIDEKELDLLDALDQDDAEREEELLSIKVLLHALDNQDIQVVTEFLEREIIYLRESIPQREEILEGIKGMTSEFEPKRSIMSKMKDRSREESAQLLRGDLELLELFARMFDAYY